TGLLTSLMFAADTRTLVSSSADGTMKLWDLSVSRPPVCLTGSARPIWLSRDGRKLLVSDSQEQLHLWNVAEFVDMGQPGPPLNLNQVLAVSPDGELVVMAPQTNRIALRALSTGKIVREYTLQEGHC